MYDMDFLTTLLAGVKEGSLMDISTWA